MLFIYDKVTNGINGLHCILIGIKRQVSDNQLKKVEKIEVFHATGANRLQTIIYVVIPQIIPPYISLTMDRWDINVSMSTVIGLGGGGGIGFLLIQNINLLNYRQASVRMIAIAIIVATMDYINSKTRQKVI